MRERFMRFMIGRYGMDDFSKFLVIVAAVFCVFNLLTHSRIFYLLAIVLLVYAYCRIFSRNHTKRYGENIRYMRYRDKVTRIFNREKSYMKQRKTHHIYTCKGCGQKIRIPRGKGKIEITCPKCGYRFVKRS